MRFCKTLRWSVFSSQIYVVEVFFPVTFLLILLLYIFDMLCSPFFIGLNFLIGKVSIFFHCSTHNSYIGAPEWLYPLLLIFCSLLFYHFCALTPTVESVFYLVLRTFYLLINTKRGWMLSPENTLHQTKIKHANDYRLNSEMPVVWAFTFSVSDITDTSKRRFIE